MLRKSFPQKGECIKMAKGTMFSSGQDLLPIFLPFLSFFSISFSIKREENEQNVFVKVVVFSHLQCD